jgi:(p)ppGpp synthase/HD superfamily hydrolase
MGMENHVIPIVASKQEFLSFLENKAKIEIDNYISEAVDVAEDVHSGVFREDGTSPFLETHTWPVAMDVVRHYKSTNRNISTIEIAEAILHDVMEDDERILNLYQSKSYGFEAYLEYRFGKKAVELISRLKIRPLENYPGSNDTERQHARFEEYCEMLLQADYNVKAIKIADRLNNMLFIRRVPGHDKIYRYIREAEDFYLAYSMLNPKMPEYYSEIRNAYERLRAIAPRTLVAA